MNLTIKVYLFKFMQITLGCFNIAFIRNRLDTVQIENKRNDRHFETVQFINLINELNLYIRKISLYIKFEFVKKNVWP